MVTTLFFGLALAAAVIVFFALVISIRAAFYGERDWRRGPPQAWRPALIQGDALEKWAAAAAEKFLSSQLAANNLAAAAPDLVAALGVHATEAMLPFARSAERERVVACGTEQAGRVGITGIEALAIVAELRARLSSREQECVLRIARMNLARLEVAGQERRDQLSLPCPLRATNLVCRAYGVRPLPCRSRHANVVARTMAGRQLPTEHVRTVLVGVTCGLARALKSAGHDENRYELNSAIVAAFDTASAAEGWAAGRPIFGSCLRAA